MDMKRSDKVGCALAALALLVAPGLYILNGCVLRILWRWFVIPVTGLPPLTIPMAIGVGLVVGFLTHQPAPRPHEDTEESTTRLLGHAIAGLLHPLIVLGVAWIVQGAL